MKEHKRRAVMVQGTGNLRITYEDGKSENVMLTGSEDVALVEATPHASCQRCGHVLQLHGFWDWRDDNGDEFWHGTACKESVCQCEGWADFTPWLEGNA